MSNERASYWNKEQDWLDQIFYRELRGKTISKDQAAILGWAEGQLKPAIRAHFTALTQERDQQRLSAMLEAFELTSDRIIGAMYRNDTAAANKYAADFKQTLTAALGPDNSKIEE